MCNPHGDVCPEIEKWLESLGFKPRWEPYEHRDIVLKIAYCASNHSGITKYTTYYPYRSIGWGGFKELPIKAILKDSDWHCIERGFDGKTGFVRP